MKTALLIIDIQNDYFPGGKMELVEPLAAARNAYELLQCFREHDLYHVHIQHVATKPGATFFLPGDRGADIHDSVAHFEGEPLVIKHHPNSFRETRLDEMLKSNSIERVIITGMMTHMCVDATARAAADFGYKVIVVENACATRDLKYGETVVPSEHVHKAFLAALRSYGGVMPASQVMARLASPRPSDSRERCRGWARTCTWTRVRWKTHRSRSPAVVCSSPGVSRSGSARSGCTPTGCCRTWS